MKTLPKEPSPSIDIILMSLNYKGSSWGGESESSVWGDIGVSKILASGLCNNSLDSSWDCLIGVYSTTSFS